MNKALNKARPNSRSQHLSIEDIKLDRRIAIYENLSLLKDNQEERLKRFLMGEHRFQ